MVIFWSIFWKVVSILITLLIILPWLVIAILPITLTLGSLFYLTIKTITTSKKREKSILKNDEIEVLKNIDYREIETMEREYRPLNLNADLEEDYIVNPPRIESEKEQKTHYKEKTVNIPLEHQKIKHKSHPKENRTTNS